MKKNILLASSTILLTNASADDKKMVDCRLVTPKTTECRPYPSKFMSTEKISYDDTKRKLIISKTLPVGPRPKLMKVINVEDMIEEHLEVLSPVRFSGSQPSPLMKTAEQKRQEKVERERDTAEAKKQMEAELAELKEKKKRLELHEEQQKELAKLKKEKKRLELEKKQKIELAKLKKEKKRLELEKKQKDKKEKALAKKKSKKTKLAKKLKKKYLKLDKKTRKNALNEYDSKLMKVVPKGKRKLRVQATAYSSHVGQTDSTPFLAAWNNRIRPGMKIIAVSRDLIKKYGLGNGKKVKIQGLPGYYTVRDKMNKRYTKRIDIYMGVNRRKALRWGRKSRIIYW